MRHDLVVFVPGITGTRLRRDGKDLWALSPGMLAGAVPPRRLLERLALPEGIGDGRPEGPFAVQADQLMTRPTGLPGLLMNLGYPQVTGLLDGVLPEQFVAFPYDWRLDNRLTARDLQARVERELARWTEDFRTHYPKAEDDPRVVLICHSMGGLVARHYLECLGGRETARLLVTVGTPHRGAAKAVRFLTGHGVGKSLLGRKAAALAGGLGERLAELCRTFPSVGQLLPVYEAVRRPGFPEGYYEDLTVLDVGLPTAMVQDVFAFHETFETAVLDNLRRSPDLRLPYRVACLGGSGHPTTHGVVVSPGGELGFLDELDDIDPWSGDGTVPMESAFAAWALRGMDEAMWNGHRHGQLISREAFGHQLDAVYHGKSARDTLAGDDDFGIEAPELAVAGEPFEIVATGVARGRPVAATLTSHDPAAPEIRTALTEAGRDELRGSLTAGPGIWVLTVQAESPKVVQREAVMVVQAQ
ncbi:lipase family alpha/beta hydrolase [Streptomyces bambusae]|uniref:Lecithin:cholesterol acyltransferase n=1 Tax=Streptomyces bambusae TaxID=1550616 RepID=A0ABS6ZAV9_9ACTN|nr:hypothetical protein [Streptomyces bambusae]MBW5484900.1 hypothetical protein [Streptomyces bambusae]